MSAAETTFSKSDDLPFLRFLMLAYSVILILLIGLATFVPKGVDVLFINGAHHPFADLFFSLITNLGDGVIFLPVIIYFLFKRFYYSILGTLLWITHGLLCAFLKRGLFYDAKRPIAILDQSLLYFVPNINVHSAHSFPSGHTATIFCAAVFIGLLSKNKVISILLLVVAVLVGYSRIYLLQHFLIDVAAGAVVGTATAFLLWHLFDQNKMPAWMDNFIKVNTGRRKSYSIPANK